jgi:DNA-binding NarL/FixJ family response regulator
MSRAADGGDVTKIRVLIAEDHETVREGLRLLLDSQPDIEVVGEAGNGKLAIEQAKTVKPDVVVMDVSMPVMSGVVATKALSEALPDTPIVALTRYTDEAYVQELLAGGASAYILKQSPSTELLCAIRLVVTGERYLDSSLAARVAGDYLAKQSTTPRRPPITDREAEVLRLMAQGYSNKEIAAKLDVSVKTIEVHKTNAMRKLNLRGRIDIVRFAILQGWLQDA